MDSDLVRGKSVESTFKWGFVRSRPSIPKTLTKKVRSLASFIIYPFSSNSQFVIFLLHSTLEQASLYERGNWISYHTRLVMYIIYHTRTHILARGIPVVHHSNWTILNTVYCTETSKGLSKQALKCHFVDLQQIWLWNTLLFLFAFDIKGIYEKKER